MANQPRAFIDDRLGGTDTVSEKIQRTPSAVRMWVHRRTVPRSIWPELLEAYPDLTIDELKAVNTAAKAA